MQNFIEKYEEKLKENVYLKKREKYFRKLVRDNELCLSINWLTDLNKIDLSQLKTDISLDNFPDDYKIIWSNTDTICEKMFKNSNKAFPKDKLWVKRSRDPQTIVRLLDFIENGNNLIPPIFTIPNDTLLVIDGNHRFALFRFLKIIEIPFIIKKTEIKQLVKIELKYWENKI